MEERKENKGLYFRKVILFMIPIVIVIILTYLLLGYIGRVPDKRFESYCDSINGDIYYLENVNCAVGHSKCFIACDNGTEYINLGDWAWWGI